MGARPLAVMDPLFFGPLTDGRQRWLFEGVVGGISSYGNSVRRPDHRWRVDLRRVLRRQPPRQRALPRCAPGRTARALGGVGAGTWPCCSARPPAATASAGSACSRRPASRARVPSPTMPSARACRSGTRSRRSASSRPACVARRSARRRDPGPRRGRARLRHERDGWQGRCRDGRRCQRRAAARGGHGAWEVMTSESQERMLAIVTPKIGPRSKRCAGDGRCVPR